MSRKLWLTWETQRRNNELAAAFQFDLLAFDYSTHKRWRRYILSVVKTLLAVNRARPEIIIAQCPSLVLITLLAGLKPLFRFHLIIDAHNAFFDYLRSRNPLLSALVRYSARQSSHIIVSNGALVDQVLLAGGVPLILPDKIPGISRREARPTLLAAAAGAIVTCICSFAPDEPLQSLLEAISQLPTRASFFITGRRERAGSLLKFESEQIKFTGFLPEEDYLALLSHSDLIIDVTTRPDCLLCGAYEALALGIPCLLSDTPALRDAFGSAAIFSVNSAPAFEAALNSALTPSGAARMDIPKARREFESVWNSLFTDAQKTLESLL